MWLERIASWAAQGALLMGGALLASGIVALVVPGFEFPTSDGAPGGPSSQLYDGLQALGMIGLLAAVIGLHRDQARQSGRLGSVGSWTAAVGAALMFVGTLLAMGSTALRGEYLVLDGILFDAALLSFLVGFPLLGIDTLRARVFPAWVGILLLAWYLVYMIVGLTLVAYGAANVAVGLLWLAIGYGLWSHRRVPPYPAPAG